VILTDTAVRDAAREHYGSDFVAVDEDARVIRADEGGHAWVQAWLLVEGVNPEKRK